jgi:SAM-dependent methyltransferase
MSFESLMTKLQGFNTSVEALAAIGAELRLRCDDLSGDSHSRSLIQDVIQKIEPGILEGLEENQERAALALIQSSLRQAIDLLENPARAPGWTNEDPILLQSQGQLSRQIVRSIGKIAMDRPDIDFALRQSGSFLDVGTGVGWLAIEAARTWPALRVVGIDLWEPALRLARKNLTWSGVGDRVELRLQSVEQLDDEAVFSLAWFPGPFIARENAARALETRSSSACTGRVACVRFLHTGTKRAGRSTQPFAGCTVWRPPVDGNRSDGSTSFTWLWASRNRIAFARPFIRVGPTGEGG